MNDMSDDLEQTAHANLASVAPAEPPAPINSRFLFVDVAALRAKQLRRGARIRFEFEPGSPVPHKPERAAMEEVRRGLVHYEVLTPKTGQTQDTA
jgi:DNA-directed RNA polymerase omega subunit